MTGFSGCLKSVSSVAFLYGQPINNAGCSPWQLAHFGLKLFALSLLFLMFFGQSLVKCSRVHRPHAIRFLHLCGLWPIFWQRKQREMSGLRAKMRMFAKGPQSKKFGTSVPLNFMTTRRVAAEVLSGIIVCIRRAFTTPAFSVRGCSSMSMSMKQYRLW